MRKRLRALSLTFTTLAAMTFLSACSESEKSATPVATGLLKTREYLITLYTTPDGPLYSVQDLDGTVLDQNIRIETLVAQYPELTWLQSDNTIEWAGLDGGVPTP